MGSSDAIRRWIPNLVFGAACLTMGVGGVLVFDDLQLGIGVFLSGIMFLGISAAIKASRDKGGASA